MKNLKTAILMMIVTTILLGVVYPLVVMGLAQVIFPGKANGQLIERDGRVIGSTLIGQPFTSPGYFRSRPSAAGIVGYDASASGGSNLGPTNQKLVERVQSDVAKLQAENPGRPHARAGTCCCMGLSSIVSWLKCVMRPFRSCRLKSANWYRHRKRPSRGLGCYR
jgi:K+-transporting ATPase KdpC subunit